MVEVGGTGGHGAWTWTPVAGTRQTVVHLRSFSDPAATVPVISRRTDTRPAGWSAADRGAGLPQRCRAPSSPPEVERTLGGIMNSPGDQGDRHGRPGSSVRHLRPVGVDSGCGGRCIRLPRSGGRGCHVLVRRCLRGLRSMGPPVEAEGSEDQADAHDAGEIRHGRGSQVAMHRAHREGAPNAHAHVRPAPETRRRNRRPEPRQDPSGTDGGNAGYQGQQPEEHQQCPVDDLHSKPPMSRLCDSMAARRDLRMAHRGACTGPCSFTNRSLSTLVSVGSSGAP